MLLAIGHSSEKTNSPSRFAEAKVESSQPDVFACGSRDPNDLSLPCHLTRDLSSVRRTLGDPTSKRIAQLFRLHPSIDKEFQAINLIKIGSADRKRLLADIESRLGVV
jgi:hypothetical protein